MEDTVYMLVHLWNETEQRSGVGGTRQETEICPLEGCCEVGSGTSVRTWRKQD